MEFTDPAFRPPKLSKTTTIFDRYIIVQESDSEIEDSGPHIIGPFDNEVDRVEYAKKFRAKWPCDQLTTFDITASAEMRQGCFGPEIDKLKRP